MQTQMIRRLLYSLKKDWGTTFDWVQIIESVVNDRTGTRQIQRQVFTIPGVLLPQSQARKFIQDIGYLAADKNFTYGALNDYNNLKFLVSIDDIPPECKLELNGYLNYNHKRFERVSFDNLAEAAFLFIARGVEGANPYARIEQPTFNVLQIQQRVTFELN